MQRPIDTKPASGAFDRRSFLRLAGVGAVALLAACTTQRQDEEVTREIHESAGRMPERPDRVPKEDPPSPEEVYTDRMLRQLALFAIWLDGVPGYIGEIGWPRDGPDRDRWDELGRRWLRAAANERFWVSYWASGPWPDAYNLTAHGGNPLEVTYDPGEALSETPRPYPECNGVNLAGWEWDEDNYPRAGSFSYLAERGITLVRVPFAWERLQPETLGPLRDEAVEHLLEVCDGAQAAGCRVVLDCHNYEEVHHWFGGDPRLMTSEEFVDLWSRLSEVLADHPAVAGYGLMNEPNPQTGSDVKGWQERSQACVSALRDRGDAQRVFVATFHWSNIDQVRTYHPDGPWIDDPADNTVYEAHQYFDIGDGGNYPKAFDDYVVKVVGAR